MHQAQSQSNAKDAESAKPAQGIPPSSALFANFACNAGSGSNRP